MIKTLCRTKPSKWEPKTNSNSHNPSPWQKTCLGSWPWPYRIKATAFSGPWKPNLNNSTSCKFKIQSSTPVPIPNPQWPTIIFSATRQTCFPITTKTRLPIFSTDLQTHLSLTFSPPKQKPPMTTLLAHRLYSDLPPSPPSPSPKTTTTTFSIPPKTQTPIPRVSLPINPANLGPYSGSKTYQTLKQLTIILFSQDLLGSILGMPNLSMPQRMVIINTG
jgi:hypothetical protein